MKSRSRKSRSGMPIGAKKSIRTCVGEREWVITVPFHNVEKGKPPSLALTKAEEDQLFEVVQQLSDSTHSECVIAVLYRSDETGAVRSLAQRLVD